MWKASLMRKRRKGKSTCLPLPFLCSWHRSDGVSFSLSHRWVKRRYQLAKRHYLCQRKLIGNHTRSQEMSSCWKSSKSSSTTSLTPLSIWGSCPWCSSCNGFKSISESKAGGTWAGPGTDFTSVVQVTCQIFNLYQMLIKYHAILGFFPQYGLAWLNVS